VRVAGAKVVVTDSFWSCSALIFAIALHGLSDFYGYVDAGIVVAAAAAPGLLAVAVLLHELGHVLSAQAHGVPVTRISLSGFGGGAHLARPSATPRDALHLALAGPAVNAALFVAAAMVARSAFGWDLADVTVGLPSVRPTTLAELVVTWALAMNLLLLAFNLLPGLPLDGGRVVQAALWRATGDSLRAWHLAACLGVAVGGLLAFAAVIALFAGDVVSAAVLGFNGAMVLTPAWALCGPLAIHRRLQETHVADHLAAPEATLSDTQSIEDAHRDVFAQRPGSCHHPVLDADGRLLGLVHRPAVAAALERGHGHLPLLHLLTPIGQDPVLVTCTGETTIGSLLAERHVEDAAELAVLDGDGRLLGMGAWKAIQMRA
jgi:Zn-dependent protease